MKLLTWLGLGALAAGFYAIAQRGGSLIEGMFDQAELAKLYAAAAQSIGLPGDWFVAIALWEGRGTIRPSAINETGADAARGGAWGAAQITLQTARDAGYTGDGPGLLDPAVNALWMAKIFAQGTQPGTLEDAASLWNSGRPFASAPDVTATKYVPGTLGMLPKAKILVS